MGVPKFYRWISERYPKINQVITDSALLPEFDHLYLDMNGIIHGCTHPSHMDVSDVLSERDMMFGIMHYLDRIITQIVKPKVSVYMAIDGVAPRAKLNQQRSRRFRSAKDMAEAHGKSTDDVLSKLEKDQESSSSEVFDSNCITPGTEFMARVSAIIQYFIRKKVKEDPLWRNLKVIFSGHEIPGEGEHKIMQHIREMRNSPDYQPNSRHCMYGQDADLIMLGLVSHEPHFTLLREVIDFSFSGNDKNALKVVKKFTKESDFQLLHLSVLREYLEIEFTYQLPKEQFNLERIIDDFVFMTFLVGNDFLPHMPSLDIGDGAFDLLFDTYKAQRPTWGDGEYLTNPGGEIAGPQRLEDFIAVIGAAETEIFEKREEDEASYTKKRRKWDKRDGKAEGPSDKQIAAQEASKQNDYMGMITELMAKHSITSGDFVDGWTPVTTPGQKDFKGRYYFEKLKLTPVSVPEHLALRKAYIEGLMWCLAYYYRGCISWGWFYPYHYGPMLSDLTNLPKVFDEIDFELGAPLKPFEQLMGCLPPASCIHVPRPYRKLMIDEQSPIIKFYPKDFEVDMNGKRNPWEGVNLLPWIDVKMLKDAINSHIPDSALTADERNRNSLGKVLCYTYDPTAVETVPSPNREIGLLDIQKCVSRVSVIDQPDRLDIAFKPELIPGTQIPSPGFPSLNVLPIKNVEQDKFGLNCFGFPSKYKNTTLFLHEMPQLPPAEQLADNVIGKSLYINWPMMHEARVVAVSDANCEVRLKKKKKNVRKWTPVEAQRWESESDSYTQYYLSGGGVPGSGGVNIGNIQIRLKLLPLQGMKTNPANGSTKKLFGTEEADVPLQLALWKAPAPDPRFVERGPLTLQDRFPPNANVVLTKGKYRGCQATVVGIVDGDKVGVKVQVFPPEPPFGLAIARSVQESYISAADASKLLQIHPKVFNKITGTLNVDPGRYDLGLNLKYRNSTCVLGYTRARKDDRNVNKKAKKAWGAGDSLLVIGSSRNGSGQEKEQGPKLQWEFTPKAVRLVAAFKQKFPQLFAAVSKYPDERFYDARQVFGPKGAEMLPKIREWLNNIETAKIPRTPTSTDAMPMAAVQAVQRAADVRTAALEQQGPLKESLIKVPPSALYREGSTTATDVMLASYYNENLAPELGDRVANLCANGIPFGARGTVVSVHDPATGCVEVVMDEEFIGGSTLQGACSNFRGKLCVWAHLLRTSASDSKGVVDQMIPVGSGKSNVEKMLGNAEKQPVNRQNSQPTEVKSSWDAQADLAEEMINKDKSESKDSRTATPSNRTASSGRAGRLVHSKEARRPAEKGTGFKGMKRGGKTGFEMWKRMVNSKKPSTPAAASGTPMQVLGINIPGSSNVPTAQNTKSSAQASEASAGLKAMLGVVPTQQTSGPAIDLDTPNATSTNAAADLKAMLGVGSPPGASSLPPIVPTASAVLPPPPPPPPSAADKLLQMMRQKEPASQPPATQSQVSGFNFTYVEEGKTSTAPTNHPAAPPAPMNPGIMPYHAGGMQLPGPYSGGPYSPMIVPMQGEPMPMGFIPVPPNPSQLPPPRPMEPEHVVDETQFPPLGGGPPTTEKKPEPDKKSVMEKTLPIVPSVIASKPRDEA